MALILHCKTSSHAALAEAWPQSVLIQETAGLVNPQLKIGLVNLMPEKTATERQWFKAMAASAYWIEPKLIRMASHTASHEPEVVTSERYEDSAKVDLQALDAVIITGAPVEHLDFEAVGYWQELSLFLDRCIQQAVPVLSICWAAQALLYKRFGLEKLSLPSKCFGLYAHQVVLPALGLEANQSLILPHSRHTGWQRQALEALSSVKLILDSPEVGPFALVDELGNYYFSGHGEYEADTLVKEYKRDLERRKPITVPKGFLCDDQGSWSRSYAWEDDFYRLFHHWLLAIDRLAEVRCSL